MTATTSERVRLIPYTIGTQFAALVANGDDSHLTDDEAEDFAALERSARDNPPEGYTFGHWAIEIDERDEFARCEATGLHGDCCRFDAVYFHKDA